MSVDISICIVTYKTKEYLRDCLESLCKSTTRVGYEVIVVDNHSQDGTLEMLQQEFPDVRWIENPGNFGFTRPTNQGLEVGKGRYLMQLNPDTLIFPTAFETLVAFMDQHKDVGICGPKVLNRDGSLQKQCRRGDSRPWAVFTYFSGLHKLFPKSKYFTGYLLDYLDEDETAEVDGVSGSCMLIRREVIEQIGYLDADRFFAYQEDADFCYRARQAGWKVYYVPSAQIIHYGGQGGSRVEPYRSIVEWHRSYLRYYRKHFARDYFFLFNWFYYGLIGGKLLTALLSNTIRKDKYAGPKR